MRDLPFLSHKQMSPVISVDAWLNASEFADVAKLKERAARNALSLAIQGRSWRGQHLTVRAIPCAGGKSGQRYEVQVSSLPPELVQKWQVQQGVAAMPEVPVAERVALETPQVKHDPQLARRTDEALWRLAVIQPIIQQPRNSPERAEAIRLVLQKEHIKPDGSRVKVSKSPLYDWVSRYERHGVEGLSPLARKDQGRQRVVISQLWDKQCPLDTDAKQQIADALTDYIRSLWSSGVTGWRVAQQMASTKLVALCEQAGWQADVTELEKLCRVTRPTVEAGREYGLIATKEQDAKLFFDKYLPRIRRNKADMAPMDVIVGDVHPIDIAVKRPDGSVAYPRAIGWMDVATNRVFFTLVLLRKGEGIKQTDIAKSFASMCAVWGLCKTLYLDNGSEYSWREMMEGFQMLSRLTNTKVKVGGVDEVTSLSEPDDNGREIIRARPYNAPAKPIEGIFGLLEQRVFAMIPGWVGGNRMKKKTHNVGREPLPFPGSWDDFQQAMEEALTFYHQTPQQGSLQGKSPQQVLETAIYQGWGKVDVSEQVLLVAFASEDKRQVKGGYISWDGEEYYHDKLLPFTGRLMTVRVARHAPHYAFVFNGRDFLCAATPAPSYGFLDPAGAKEQQRRQKLLNREIAERKSHTNRLDLVAEMARHNATQAPMPESPVQTTVVLSTAVQQMIEAANSADLAALEETKTEKAARTKTKQLSQWSSPDEIDPLLAAVSFDDE